MLVTKVGCKFALLYIQVFKGAIVRRTETAEETAEILSKFYQMSGGRMNCQQMINMVQFDCSLLEYKEFSLLVCLDQYHSVS